MKKLCLVVAVLMVVAAPALATTTVTITCTPTADPNVLSVNYTVVKDPNMVRAFALDITVDSPAKINDVNNYPVYPTNYLNKYWVYPGSIVIANNDVNDVGSPVADPNFPGTLGGIDTNGVTIEMGSLYYPTGDNSPNAPPLTGTLLKFKVCHKFVGCKVYIKQNTIRGGVVPTNPSVVPTVNIASPAYTFPAEGYLVPNVVGLTEAAAIAAITNPALDSLVCTKTYNWDPVVAKGIVISQVPVGGTIVPSGSTVAIVVSLGPTPVNCITAGTAYDTQRTQFNTYVTNKWDPTQWCAYNATTNPKGGFQCHGDADGLKSSPDGYRVYLGDLTLVTGNWKKKMGIYPAGADPRADIDHKASSPDNYRVYLLDLSRTTTNWKRKDCTTTCNPPTVCNLPRNCPLTDAANTTYVKPTSCP